MADDDMNADEQKAFDAEMKQWDAASDEDTKSFEGAAPLRIPLEECVNGGLYRIHSRNLTYGVFKESSKGFIGVREKFGDEYLFTEYHWDADPHCGTVNPKEFIEMCPITPLDENNNELFEWLKEKERSQ